MDEDPKKSSTPIIHTLESDTLGMIQNIPASYSSPEDNVVRTKKILMIIAIGMLVLFCALSAYLYFTFIKKPTPVVEIINPPRIYKLVDVLPEFNSKLSTYTNLATSTESSIIVDIVTFDNVYAYLIQNESTFGQILASKFNLGSVSEFTDINIQNNDVRIADGETGLIVYGYVEQKKLIITTSIEEWLRIKSNI